MNVYIAFPHCRSRRGIKCLLWLLCLLSSFQATAAFTDTPQFANPEDNTRYQTLIRQIRCPTCQNSDIGESNAPLARQLRQQIAKKIQAGKSNQDITSDLQKSYGDFITYKPPFKAETLFLWLAPFAVMLLALSVFIIRRKNKQHRHAALTPQQQQQLQQWLLEDENAP